MQAVWHNFTPYYAEGLSRSHLVARDTVFAAGDSHLRASEPRPPHWHDAYEMGFVLSGTGVIVMGERAYAYVPGQVYIINDFDPHMGYAESAESTLFAIHFHPCILESGWIGQMRQEARTPFLPQFGQDGPLLPLDHPIAATVRALLEAVRAEVLQRQALWDVVVCGQIVQAVGLLAREAMQGTPPTPEALGRRRALKTLQPVMQLLQARYTEALSLDELASAGGLSPSYCCELFRKALDTTPIAYRNALRVAKACRLLQHTDLTLRAITYQVGFQSVQELHRLFRKQVGCTPQHYLAKLRQD